MERKIIKSIVICTIFILLGTGVAQQAQTAFANIHTGSIVAYGAEAQSFASTLSAEITKNGNVLDRSQSVIVLSDVSTTNFQSIANNMRNGALLVAINLPVDNDFVAIPTIQENIVVERAILNSPSRRDSSEIISQASREIVPPYWIVVAKDTTPSLTANCMTLNEGEQSREVVVQMALEEVNSALFSVPDRGGTGESHWIHRDTRTNSVEFGTNKVNIYQVRHKIYQLDVWDRTTNHEYWQVESWVDSYIGMYESTSSHCGPYLQSRQIYVSANANIYDYGPGTTPESTTATVNIGFEVNTGGAGVNIGYSESWLRDGVRYDVARGAKWLEWTEGYRGPNYIWWPWYPEPCATSHNGNPTTTRVIFDPYVGNGIKLDFTDTFNLRNDYLYPVGPILYIEYTTYWYNFWWTNWNYSSMF